MSNGFFTKLIWEGGRSVVMVVKGVRGRSGPVEKVVVGEMVAMVLKPEHNTVTGFLAGDLTELSYNECADHVTEAETREQHSDCAEIICNLSTGPRQ